MMTVYSCCWTAKRREFARMCVGMGSLCMCGCGDRVVVGVGVVVGKGVG
jgi:hypothetical protein